MQNSTYNTVRDYRHFATLKNVMKHTCAMAAFVSLSACATKGTNPQDPYESMNRKTYQFNHAFDAALLKPAAKVYTTILPAPVRSGINNVYDNVNMIPTIANDLLQAEGRYVVKDFWRLVVNSTVGIGGIFDVAKSMNLPPHSNDLGITFAKWGNTQSPYLIIPFLGPSTFRDGMGLMFNYALLTPYPYLDVGLAWALVGVRYVDLRSQMFDTDKFMNEALDQYAFMRDAYLQHRHYLITGAQNQAADSSSLYVDENSASPQKSGPLLPEEPENGTKSQFPLTTALHATHRPASA
jgi:phospholipid-binding lipoprotein MlaA